MPVNAAAGIANSIFSRAASDGGCSGLTAAEDCRPPIREAAARRARWRATVFPDVADVARRDVLTPGGGRAKPRETRATADESAKRGRRRPAGPSNKSEDPALPVERGSGVSLHQRLQIAEDPAAMPGVSAKIRKSMIKAVRVRVNRVILCVCSGQWEEAIMHTAPTPPYPPPADTPNCRMVRARDMDHIQKLQPGQSKQRMVPPIYTTARGYSHDAVIEATELRKVEVGMGRGRRASTVICLKTGEYL